MTISQARDRLNRAVSRAEAALEQHVAQEAAVKEDLSAALAAAQAENESLRAANADISARLDSAIGRLRAVLGDQA